MSRRLAGPPVHIVGAVRTPVGRRKGQLAQAHPVDLAAHVLAAVLVDAGIGGTLVNDVILGCVDALGAQAGNIARVALLSAGFPEEVPGVTIDRRCGSSQQAVEFAVQGIAAGVHDIVVAGGVENMSMVPILSPIKVGSEHGMGDPYESEGWKNRYGGAVISQFRGAEMMAAQWEISRLDMERFALTSHQRAVAATDAGWFADEIVPYGDATVDEGPRRDTSLERMASLEPLAEGGRLTAAVSSQVSDGAAALVLASDDAVRRLGLRSRATVVASSVVGSDPVMMLAGPIPATRSVMARAGLTMADIDLAEVNEAFASVPLAWAKELDADLERTNVNGGAIALGHPLGATGARLMVSLVHEMERRHVRYGLQTMCEGLGTANATILERTA
jgi:acetyl-CoA C-acetyltransferase